MLGPTLCQSSVRRTMAYGWWAMVSHSSKPSQTVFFDKVIFGCPVRQTFRATSEKTGCLWFRLFLVRNTYLGVHSPIQPRNVQITSIHFRNRSKDISKHLLHVHHFSLCKEMKWFDTPWHILTFLSDDRCRNSRQKQRAVLPTKARKQQLQMGQPSPLGALRPDLPRSLVCFDDRYDRVGGWFLTYSVAHSGPVDSNISKLLSHIPWQQLA